VLWISGPEIGVPRLRPHQLTLVPAVFARAQRLLSLGPSGTAAVSYQARGAAAALETRRLSPVDQHPDDPLAILLGRARASVIRSLIVPMTTTGLARSLGLAASTVSEHLSGLVAAGVVKRHRAGGRVLYELDNGGMALLRLR
jgi:DNA-binding transcriptional ArsR family regulator